MANMMLAWPNRFDGAALDQGDWVTEMPLDNLLDRVLAIKARCLTPDYAHFRATLSSDYQIRAISLCNHNLSPTATYRITGGNDASFGTYSYDSGWLNAWPIDGGASEWVWLEWEDDRFWLGTYSGEAVTGYRANTVLLLPTAVRGKYWHIQIRDEGNYDGYIELGRVFMGPVWQPVYNLRYGANIGWNSRTEVSEARSGTEYFDIKAAYRSLRGELKHMTTDEAMSQAFESQRRMDVHGEMLFVYNPDDDFYMIYRAFLCRYRVLNNLEQPYWNDHSIPIELKELL